MNYLKDLIKDKNIWFKNKYDCLYLTKFDSSNLNVFYVSNKWYVITDSRYINSMKNTVKNMEVLDMMDMPFLKVILPQIENSNKPLYIDEKDFSLQEYNAFKKRYENLNLKAIDLSSLRIIKTEEEINLIKKACDITDDIFKKLIKEIKVNQTEKDIEKILLKLIIDSDADDYSFWPIIAAGKNSANPHWKATDYKIKENDIITIDFGVKYKNYISDITRTFSIGKKVSKEEEAIHALVLEGMEEAIKMIKPGIKISELEKKVRKIFKRENYEKYFNHALGHGIGLEVHENPIVYQTNDDLLQENMVITIEPGIYINGKYGCRIEQDIWVTKNGGIQLNKANKNLYLK